MAGLLNIPKFVDFRNKVMRHPTLKFPVLNLKGKTTIAIHHSLTKQGLGGSNAESYALYHVQTNGWPSIGYSYVIEPDGTIKFCNDIELRTYHVGNHNNYAVGICLTGDFRSENPTAAQKESLRNLVQALQKAYPHLKYVKGHNEFSGYEWKACPVFDYKKVLAEKGTVSKPTTLPNTYTIQQGDTLWSVSKGLKLTVDDLTKANPGIKPTQLQIGQKINLGTAKVEKPKNPTVNTSKPETGIKVGQKATLKSTASKYATGENIPVSIKGKAYTVQQIKSDRVLLKEIYSWVRKADITGGTSSAVATKPKKLKAGQRVKLKSSASKYATGQNIPTSIKNKNYTIQQVKSDRVLLKEIYSWVKISDIQ
ncbi:N-acetylmuramoyl-L-alanine amidase [Lederbergia lenta]|uniref:N-acetylmuramoyl-L-alanine amidase n=1 Tax=Lederbergia lenta TaxID=1467 RepID=UPI00203AD92D|nr:N-acetylmuramoyl-L-alanine amidase [Lederbergia lenta]MCM3110694.1 N-acetylmuramoyl-L-alanine amidase [Lederbergia lenta]